MKMLIFTLRTWPKAQHLARALGIPVDAWEIPFLFVAVGGPELSVFEAMEKPELGGLTARLKALTKPLAAAAHDDVWVREHVRGESKIAVAFHPGVNLDQLREMSSRDGYDVVDMATALAARRATDVADNLDDEGLLDGFGRLSKDWPDADRVARTLALPAWHHHHHSAAFFLLGARWDDIDFTQHAEARDALKALGADVLHPVITRRLAKLS